MRPAGIKAEIEGEFGVHEIEGTLVLTNDMLVFACTNEKEEDLPLGAAGDFGVPTKVRLVYSDVEDLGQVPMGPPNLSVSLGSISATRGRKSELGKPSLEDEWKDDDGRHAAVFTETLVGRRRRNLNDWAPIILNVRDGRQKLVDLPKPPSVDTLDGKVVRVLSDMQEKGVLTIEEAVEEEFKLDLDPDEVQAACDSLSSLGVLIRYPEPSGDIYYRRESPLGEEDLAS